MKLSSQIERNPNNVWIYKTLHYILLINLKMSSEEMSCEVQLWIIIFESHILNYSSALS